MIRSVATNDPTALSGMLASNHSLLQQMTVVGGKDYRQYGMVISQAEWVEHFGPDVWRRFSDPKKKFDPNKELTPRPETFQQPVFVGTPPSLPAPFTSVAGALP